MQTDIHPWRLPALPALLRAAACVAALALVACGGGDHMLGQSDLTELQIEEVQPGSGETAAPGAEVSVHYTGWLYDGARADHRGPEFDSSRGGDPFAFRLGAGAVIAGWDQGVAGMRVGGRRILTIPPDLAYDAMGAGGGAIPPNATLVFDVELLAVN